jgi:D-glycero-D-manno-heptose 1,7-bisphosphate phosphatase
MIDADGVWVERLRQWPFPPGTPALFLDRDGVLVEDHGFLTDPRAIRMIPGAGRIVAAANRLGIAVVVVTNQSGIGRGLFDWDAFVRVEAAIRARLAAAAGGQLDAVLACPHHPEALSPHAHPESPHRKPNPGMILKAAALFGLGLDQSWIIGDRATDLLAGKRAGLSGGLLVGPPHRPTAASEWQAAAGLADDGGFQVHRIGSIADAEGVLPWPLRAGQPLTDD